MVHRHHLRSLLAVPLLLAMIASPPARAQTEKTDGDPPDEPAEPLYVDDSVMSLIPGIALRIVP